MSVQPTQEWKTKNSATYEAENYGSYSAYYRCDPDDPCKSSNTHNIERHRRGGFVPRKLRGQSE